MNHDRDKPPNQQKKTPEVRFGVHFQCVLNEYVQRENGPSKRYQLMLPSFDDRYTL